MTRSVGTQNESYNLNFCESCEIFNTSPKM